MLRHSFCLSLLAAITLPLTALSPPAQAAANTGLTFASQDELRGVPLAATPFSGAELPKKLDLSAHMPPPGNQGKQNSCVGWATAYALKSYQEKVEERRTLARNGRIDPKLVFSPAFIYNQINNGRDGGSSFIDALNLLSNQGAVSLAEMPYSDRDFRKPPPRQLQAQARRYRIDYWRQVNIHDQKEVKAQINAGYPVLIGAMIDESFVNARAGFVWKRSQGRSLGGHAMVVVGYDDARQAFKLINSWGTGWGDQGFGWVDYGFFKQAVREGYVAKDALNGKAANPPQQPDQQPDPSVDPDEEYNDESEDDYEDETDPSLSDDDEQPSADQASFSIGNVEHNLQAPSSEYNHYGKFMKLTGPINVPPGAGQQMQVVVRFYYDNGKGGKGKPVAARLPELFSVSDEGVAATGTPLITLPASGVDKEWYAYIPYRAFQLPAGKVNLLAEPMLYVDNFGIRSGKLIPFWVDLGSHASPKPTQSPSAQTTKSTQSAPAEAARGFFMAMHQENYQAAWRLLSETSRQQFVQLVHDYEPSLGTSELRRMFDSGDDLIMEEFWPSMREELNTNNWVSQSYSVQQIQGNQAWVLASPSQVKMLMKLEGGSWKLAYMETFMK